MFKVEEKSSTKIHIVYAVSHETNPVKFLLYYKDKWQWMKSDLFRPYKEMVY